MMATRRERLDKAGNLFPTTRAVLALAFFSPLAIGLPTILRVFSNTLPGSAITPATGGILLARLVGRSVAI
jgi:hypothetical protein